MEPVPALGQSSPRTCLTTPSWLACLLEPFVSWNENPKINNRGDVQTQFLNVSVMRRMYDSYTTRKTSSDRSGKYSAPACVCALFKVSGGRGASHEGGSPLYGRQCGECRVPADDVCGARGDLQGCL